MSKTNISLKNQGKSNRAILGIDICFPLRPFLCIYSPFYVYILAIWCFSISNLVFFLHRLTTMFYGLFIF